jgi:hypothetical protein
MSARIKTLHQSFFSSFWLMGPEFMRSQFALPPTPARLADSTWQCRHHANSKTLIPNIQWARWVTHLVMVDNVDPWDDMDEELRVPGVTGSHAL